VGDKTGGRGQPPGILPATRLSFIHRVDEYTRREKRLAHRTKESPGISRRLYRLCGKLLSPLSPSATNHVAAVGRAHSFQEPVGSLSFQPARLKGPFHSSIPLSAFTGKIGELILGRFPRKISKKRKALIKHEISGLSRNINSGGRNYLQNFGDYPPGSGGRAPIPADPAFQSRHRIPSYRRGASPARPAP
jgi:hypothetical protein